MNKTRDPDLMKLEELFNNRFQEDCPTCHLVNCVCDEETMALMEREQECAE